MDAAFRTNETEGRFNTPGLAFALARFVPIQKLRRRHWNSRRFGFRGLAPVAVAELEALVTSATSEQVRLGAARDLVDRSV
jgi:hypothetical protein